MSPRLAATLLALVPVASCADSPERAYRDIQRGYAGGQNVERALARFTEGAVERLALVCTVHGLHDWARLRVQEIFADFNDKFDGDLSIPDGRGRAGGLAEAMRAHGFEDEDFERLTKEVCASFSDSEEDESMSVARMLFDAGSPLFERCARIPDRRAFVRDLLPLVQWDVLLESELVRVELDGNAAEGVALIDDVQIEVHFVRDGARWKVDAFGPR